MKKIFKRCLLIVISFILVFALFIADYYNLLPQKKYYNSDFSIETVYSEVDYNNNGKDDYTDFLLGAKKTLKINLDMMAVMLKAAFQAMM